MPFGKLMLRLIYTGVVVYVLNGGCIIDRRKTLFNSSVLAEMQLSSTWRHFGGHVDVNHENGGTLLSGI